jgi:hypothetical protein
MVYISLVLILYIEFLRLLSTIIVLDTLYSVLSIYYFYLKIESIVSLKYLYIGLDFIFLYLIYSSISILILDFIYIK